MKTLKEKIIVGFIVVAIIMTAFPPQKIQTRSTNDARLIGERIKYQFIGSESRNTVLGLYDQSSIAFDRLLLQYLVLAGAGFAIYLLIGKKD